MSGGVGSGSGGRVRVAPSKADRGVDTPARHDEGTASCPDGSSVRKSIATNVASDPNRGKL